MSTTDAEIKKAVDDSLATDRPVKAGPWEIRVDPAAKRFIAQAQRRGKSYYLRAKSVDHLLRVIKQVRG